MVEQLDYYKEAQRLAARTRSTKIIRYFPASDLRCGHDGLRKIAKENGVDPWDLKPGEFLVFSNLRKNKLKIYAPGNVIAYLKSPDGHRLDLNVVRLIPRFFNGTEFDYKGALKETIEVKMLKAS